jgi:hypothetical protein
MMKAGPAILFALAAVAAIPGCDRPQADQRHLTVSGPRAAIERFIALEEAGNPALLPSAVQSLPGDRSRVRFDIPADYGGDDLVGMTKAAVDAGLSYQLESGGKPSPAR